MRQDIRRDRKPTTRLALVAAATMGLLAASVASAIAAPTDPPDGAFNAAAHVNVPVPPTFPPQPPEECATYSLYNAALVFRKPPNDPEAGALTGERFTARSNSDPQSGNFQWGENGNGTFNPQTILQPSTPCNNGPGAEEDGFRGTFTKKNGDECTLSGGSYARTDINITYSFKRATPEGTGTCPAASDLEPFVVNTELLTLQEFNPPLEIGPFGLTYLAACNSIIAPTSCVLTKSRHTP